MTLDNEPIRFLIQKHEDYSEYQEAVKSNFTSIRDKTEAFIVL